MGADYEDEDKKVQDLAISIMQALPQKVKNCLSHHLRNPLTAIKTEAQLSGLSAIDDEVNHIVKDLEMFGL